jgi:hypothetical protein
MERINKISAGLIIGLLLPVISLVVYYYLKHYPVAFSEFLKYAKANTPALTPLIAISLLLNIAVFTLLINTNHYKAGKGIFWGTVIYGIIAFVFKLLA